MTADVTFPYTLVLRVKYVGPFMNVDILFLFLNLYLVLIGITFMALILIVTKKDSNILFVTI